MPGSRLRYSAKRLPVGKFSNTLDIDSKNNVQFDNLGQWVIIAATNQGVFMLQILRRLRDDESGQDIAEYAVMLAVILLLVVGTIKLIGSNANNTFSSVASTLQ